MWDGLSDKSVSVTTKIGESEIQGYPQKAHSHSHLTFTSPRNVTKKAYLIDH